MRDALLFNVESTEPGECWEFLGTRDKDGYGRLAVDGRKTRAHRVAWVVYRGEIPEGLHVLHTCDVPACVNPEHLFLGTHADNMHDRDAKGRAVVPVRRGGKATGSMRRVRDGQSMGKVGPN
jgi:hypothetical protein